MLDLSTSQRCKKIKDFLLDVLCDVLYNVYSGIKKAHRQRLLWMLNKLTRSHKGSFGKEKYYDQKISHC